MKVHQENIIVTEKVWDIFLKIKMNGQIIGPGYSYQKIESNKFHLRTNRKH